MNKTIGVLRLMTIVFGCTLTLRAQVRSAVSKSPPDMRAHFARQAFGVGVLLVEAFGTTKASVVAPDSEGKHQRILERLRTLKLIEATVFASFGAFIQILSFCERPFFTHPNPVNPQKTVGESDSPTIDCD